MSSKELVISQSQHETKVGILEDGQLVEVFFQRANEYSLAGSIHKGRVTRVLPGMQSAFVDLGLERDCFLYVSDFFDEHGDEFDKVSDDRRSDRDRDRNRDRDRDRGRQREREREQEPVQAVPPPQSATEPGGPVEEETAGEVPSAQGEREAQATAEGPQQRERRGRRSRRRRRGGRGFPESKYASSDAAPAEAAAEVEEPSDEEIVLLPGESLAKYRKPEAAVESARRVETEPQGEKTTPDLPEEAYIEAAEDAAEQILDRIEEMEFRAEVAGASAMGELPEPEVPAAEEPEAAEDTAETIFAEPLKAPGIKGRPEEIELTEVGSSEEMEAVDAQELDEEPSQALSGPEGSEPAEGEEVEAGEAESVEEEGVEPARMPQSLTATLRAQGGRLPHRMSRRMRRRRGGQGSEAGEARMDEAPERTEIRAPERPERQERAEHREDRRERERPPLPSISELLKEGQEIIVQIAKEPLGQKGARITSHIALPGRYVVYMPTVEHLGVSRKIASDEERQRLKRILQRHREGVAGGFIMRTAGEGKTEDDIAADMQYLANLWLEIRAKAEKRRAPALLHHDIEVVQRILRDQLTDGFKAVWVDNEELYEQVLHAVERMAPGLLSKVKLYTRPEPIFDAFGITQELEKALRPKVWLKSGGYIVINQTEALVAIDINTGKYVGRSNRLEDTIVKTNLEAVKEIVRQIRLRDLGGIIVIDFIDMDERKNRQKIMQALEDTMRSDKAPYKILQFNDFGLVAITRKRVKQSLERALCAPCPYCEGAGYVKSTQTVIGEILAQAQKYAKVVDGKEVVLRVNPEVALVLKSVKNKYLEELEEVLGRPVLVVSDTELHREKFDLT
jgi:ribonuclease G